MNEADEISLFDLWRVLVRQRLVIGGVLILAIAAGALYGITKEPLYEYTAVIQLGDAPAGTQEPLSAERAVSAMRVVHLPEAIERSIADDPALPVPNIEVQLEEGEGILVLSGQAGESAGPHYIDVMAVAAEALVAAQLPGFNAIRQSLESRLEQLREQVAATEREAGALRQSQAQLDALEASLRSQTSALEAELAGMREQRSRLTQGEGTPQPSVQPLLALNQSIAEILGQLTDLKSTADLDITQRRDELIENIASKEWTKHNHLTNIAQLKSDLEQLEPTRLAREPRRSLKPTGPGAPVVVAVSGILGLILGVFVAFLVEFLRKARDIGA